MKIEWDEEKNISNQKKHDIIVVVHTERIRGELEYIRIISARKSVKSEEIIYLKRKGVI